MASKRWWDEHLMASCCRCVSGACALMSRKCLWSHFPLLAFGYYFIPGQPLHTIIRSARRYPCFLSSRSALDSSFRAIALNGLKRISLVCHMSVLSFVFFRKEQNKRATRHLSLAGWGPDAISQGSSQGARCWLWPFVVAGRLSKNPAGCHREDVLDANWPALSVIADFGNHCGMWLGV